MSKSTESLADTKRSVRYYTTRDAGAFLGWASGHLHIPRTRLIDMGVRLLHDKLEEIYDDVPALESGAFDYDSLE